MTRDEMITVRQLCAETNLSLGAVKRLAGIDPEFPPIEWTGPRSGFLFRVDFDAWRESRFERAQRRREQQDRRTSFVKGRESELEGVRELPDFLQ